MLHIYTDTQIFPCPLLHFCSKQFPAPIPNRATIREALHSVICCHYCQTDAVSPLELYNPLTNLNTNYISVYGVKNER
jgi:hypothetical protein